MLDGVSRRQLVKGSVGASALLGAPGWALRAFGHGVPPETVKHDTTFADPFLVNEFAPVFLEWTREPLEVVQGRLPPDLRGAYLRNGMNPAFMPKGYQYPLDGDGMIHAVSIKGGRATYSNRFVRTKGFLAEQRIGRSAYGGAGAGWAPDTTVLRPDEVEQPKNVANTNIVEHAGKLLALYEAGLPYRLDEQLGTIGTWDFGGKVQRSMIAHLHADPETNELHFSRYVAPETMPPLTYFVADAAGEVVRAVDLDVRRGVMYHDFALSRRWAVFVETSSIFGTQGYQWHPELPTRFVLVERGTDHPQVHYLETPAFFVFHLMNAVDQKDGSVLVDLVRWSGFGAGASAGPGPYFTRFTVDPARGRVTEAPFDDLEVEFPRLDPRRIGKPYRLGYAAATQREPLPGQKVHAPDGLVQYDVVRGSRKLRAMPVGWTVGEPIFVPKAGAPEETGYVLVYAYDGPKDESFLLVLDTERFTDEPVATLRMPARIPQGLHGNWVTA